MPSIVECILNSELERAKICVDHGGRRIIKKKRKGKCVTGWNENFFQDIQLH
jgi:hypothetical protein